MHRITVKTVAGEEITVNLPVFFTLQEVTLAITEKLGVQKYNCFFRMYEKDLYCAYPLPKNARLSDLLTQQGIQEKSNPAHFLLSIGYYNHMAFLRNASQIQNHPVFTRLIFEQAVYDIHGGRYLKTDADFYALAALILQSRLQDSLGDPRLLQ